MVALFTCYYFDLELVWKLYIYIYIQVYIYMINYIICLILNLYGTGLFKTVLEDHG